MSFAIFIIEGLSKTFFLLSTERSKSKMFTFVFFVSFLPTALSSGYAMAGTSLAPAVSLFNVSGDQRWRQMDFGVKPQSIKRSRREVLAAWLQSVRADGV